MVYNNSHKLLPDPPRDPDKEKIKLMGSMRIGDKSQRREVETEREG